MNEIFDWWREDNLFSVRTFNLRGMGERMLLEAIGVYCKGLYFSKVQESNFCGNAHVDQVCQV